MICRAIGDGAGCLPPESPLRNLPELPLDLMSIHSSDDKNEVHERLLKILELYFERNPCLSKGQPSEDTPENREFKRQTILLQKFLEQAREAMNARHG